MSTNDPEFQETPKFSPEQYEAPPPERGCFFYGCIIAGVLAVLMAIFLGILAFVAYRFFNRMIDEYTGTEPIALPALKMSDENRDEVKNRWDSFRKAVNAGTASEPLVLTSDDLNALIEQNPELKGKIYVSVESDQVKGKVSFPLGDFMPYLKGRYLNGEADLKASLFDGELIVHLDGLEVNGKKVPEDFMKEMRKQNVAKDAAKDKDFSAALRKLESLEIKDGKIILKVRAKSAGGDKQSSKVPTPVEVVPSQNGQPKNGAAKPAETKPTPATDPVPAKAATKTL
jgi:hypothetical protein